ncbi:uncharacterized protein LOC127774258 [Oryza glaberrima]|uniref:uncharacterized protein LOC127774258 n=1 Tax=Oryza glaberrima TaxID=4538 RepID=UPI00224C4828|nr:uncharacterized protein LOC127774258 [Oryza glaberrima]
MVALERPAVDPPVLLLPAEAREPWPALAPLVGLLPAEAMPPPVVLLPAESLEQPAVEPAPRQPPAPPLGNTATLHRSFIGTLTRAVAREIASRTPGRGGIKGRGMEATQLAAKRECKGYMSNSVRRFGGDERIRRGYEAFDTVLPLSLFFSFPLLPRSGAEARRRPQRGSGGGASPGFTADSDDARQHPGAWLPLSLSLSLSLLFFSPSSSSQRSRGATTVGWRRRRIARARRVQHRQALALRVEGRRRCHCCWPWRVRAGGRQYTDLDWQGSGAAWTLLAGHDAARSSTQHARHGHSPACRCPLQPNSVRLALQWRRWWWPPPLFLRLHGQLPPVEVTEWGTSMTARREKTGTLSLLLRLLVVLQPWNNLLF